MASLVEIGPVVLENYKIFKFVNVFSQFHNYLPLEKAGALHLNKLESPSFKDDMCQVWLKLAKQFPRRRFFKFVNVFSQFRNYLPLGKGKNPYLNKLESPSPKDALCQVWLKLAQWFWRRRWKCEKFTTTTTTTMTTTTTTTKQQTNFDQKSSFELTAQVS